MTVPEVYTHLLWEKCCTTHTYRLAIDIYQVYLSQHAGCTGPDWSKRPPLYCALDVVDQSRQQQVLRRVPLDGSSKLSDSRRTKPFRFPAGKYTDRRTLRVALLLPVGRKQWREDPKEEDTGKQTMPLVL